MDLKQFLNKTDLENTNEFYQEAVMKLGGPEAFTPYIPFDKAILTKSYKQDKHFNASLTPLAKWDDATGIYVQPGQTTKPPIATGGKLWNLLSPHGITWMSQSQAVMLLKTAAAMLVTQS